MADELEAARALKPDSQGQDTATGPCEEPGALGGTGRPSDDMAPAPPTIAST
jgi:hypothetical protein